MAAVALAAGLAGSPGCVHHQLTNRQVGIAVLSAAVVTGIILLLVTQCSGTSCENSPPP